MRDPLRKLRIRGRNSAVPGARTFGAALLLVCLMVMAPSGCVDVRTLRPVETVHCAYATFGTGQPHEILCDPADDRLLYTKVPERSFRVRLDRLNGRNIRRLDVIIRQECLPRDPVIFLAPWVRLYVDGELHSEQSLLIRDSGFTDCVYRFDDVGRARDLDVEVESWAVGWMGPNGTLHHVSSLEARAWTTAAPLAP